MDTEVPLRKCRIIRGTKRGSNQPGTSKAYCRSRADTPTTGATPKTIVARLASGFNWVGNVHPDLPSDRPKIPAPFFPSTPACWNQRVAPPRRDELDDVWQTVWYGDWDRATKQRTSDCGSGSTLTPERDQAKVQSSQEA